MFCVACRAHGRDAHRSAAKNTPARSDAEPRRLWIRELYPVQELVQNELKDFAKLLQTARYPWLPWLMMAVLPAVCEELAFRGFVLSGLRHLGSKRWSIGLAAVFFGMAHGIIQQSLSAAALGTVIGYIAVQTGS